VVKVRVQEVDLARKRISLTMKLDAAMPAKGAARSGDNSFRAPARGERLSGGPASGGQSAMAAAFAKLKSGG
jgi:protein Tex